MVDTEREDPERARSLVSHTLCQFVGSIEKGRISAAMSLVIPTLLARTASEGEELYKETSSRLLELAGVDQEVFRAVVAGMSGAHRTFLEEVIRSGTQTTGASMNNASSADAGQPSIALKMDFGASM